nr:PD-(D/E)XK nuclease family protein [Treponema berlinense]
MEVNVSLRENFSQKSCSPKDIVKTKIQTPNLFSFATSELSQDAFFAWFFSWAESKYKNVDKDLHECAKTSLARFYGSGLPNEIYSIEIQKQYNNIDLWLKINDEYDLIIEDKTNTTMHDNQLARYKSYFVDNKKSRFVYLKTGDFKSGEENFARINGYRIIDTFILDDLFKNCLTANEIFKDYSNMIRTRKIIKQLVQKFNELNLYSRCDMYKNTCLYFWFNFNKQNQSFLALDIVFSLQCQKLELIFHGKKDGKGSWIDSGDELDLLIKHISPKVRKILNNYDFEPKYNYYTSSIEYEDSLDVFNLLKNLINELEKVINYSLIN